MLIDHEVKMFRYRKTGLTEPMSINVAQATQTHLQPAIQTQPNASSMVQPNAMSQFIVSRGGFRGGRSFARGRGGRFGGRFKV